MATQQVNIHEAKTDLSKLINGLEHGDEVVIANRGTPVARLVPIVRETNSRPLGTIGGGTVLDDSVFDDLTPLDSDEDLREIGWPV